MKVYPEFRINTAFHLRLKFSREESGGCATIGKSRIGFFESLARIASTANAPYKYKDRIAKDRQILIGLAELSLGERFERLQNLKVEIQKMEESLANKRSDSQTEQQKRAILADEDGLIELKCRFALERSEYLARKAITPDFREPAGASG